MGDMQMTNVYILFSLQLDQTSNTITRDAYLANTSYHSLVSISAEVVMTCIPEFKGKEEILCLQIVIIC